MTIPRLALCAFMVCCGSVRAGAQEPVPLTVGDAVARALETSHRLAEARAREQGAQATVRVRRASDLPVVSVSGGYTRTNHVEEFAVPGPGGFFQIIYPDVPDNYFTRVAMQWPIYSGGRSDALERAAEAEARAAAADINVTRADLRLEVVRAYWALATAAESVRVLDESLERADAHLRDMRARFDAGLVPPNEVSAAAAQRSRQQMQLIEARNLRAGVAEDLRRLTGITADVIPVDKLESAGAALPAAVQLRAEQIALTERIDAADERRRAAEAGRKPSVAITSNFDYARPNARIFPRTDEWQAWWEAGVTVNWTAWDSGRNAAETAEAAAAATALRARRAELDAIIATDIRQRQLDLDSARAALVAANDAVQSAEETRRVLAERFAVGVATSTEVLDAQLALLQAELDRTRALANIRLAEARLERALGQ